MSILKLTSLLIFLILNYKNGMAEDLQALPEGEFQTHMIDHDNPGCPANAHCHSSYGLKRKAFQDLVIALRSGQNSGPPHQAIERHRLQHGIPFPVWATPESLTNTQVASWHSSCTHHNREINQIFLGEVLISSLADLPPEAGHLHPHRTWAIINDQVVTYLIPQASVPGLLIDDQLYFTREEQGVYYGLLVAQNGGLKVVDIESSPVTPREVSCPKELRAAKENWDERKHIYQRFYCRAIWDKTRRTYQTFLVGWSC